MSARVEVLSRDFGHVELLTMNRRGHWANDDTARKDWKHWARIMSAIIKAQRGSMQMPVKITIALYWPDRRVRDSNNYAQTGKAIVDGFVQSGLLSDDRDSLVIGPDMRRIPKHKDRTSRSLIVIIEETTIDAELATIARHAALTIGQQNQEERES